MVFQNVLVSFWVDNSNSEVYRFPQVSSLGPNRPFRLDINDEFKLSLSDITVEKARQAEMSHDLNVMNVMQ